MFDIIVVVIAKEDADSIVFGLRRDGGCGPLDGIFKSDLPEVSKDGISDSDGKLDRGGTSFDDGGISNRRCGHQINKGEDRENLESGITEVAENRIIKQPPKYGVVEGSGFGWVEESVETCGERGELFYVEEEKPDGEGLTAFIFRLRVHQVEHNSGASTTIL